MAHLTLAGAMNLITLWADYQDSTLDKSTVTSNKDYKMEQPWNYDSLLWQRVDDANVDVSHSSSSSDTKVFSVKEKQQWVSGIKSGVVNHPPRAQVLFLWPRMQKRITLLPEISFLLKVHGMIFLSRFLSSISVPSDLFYFKQESRSLWTDRFSAYKGSLTSEASSHAHMQQWNVSEWDRLHFVLIFYTLDRITGLWSFFEYFLYLRNVFTKCFLWDIGSFWQCVFCSSKWLAVCVFISRFLKRSAPLPYAD